MNRFCFFLISCAIFCSSKIYCSNGIDSDVRITFVVFGGITPDYFSKNLGIDVNKPKEFKKIFGTKSTLILHHVPSNKRDYINREDEFSYLPVYGQNPSCKFSFCEEFNKIDWSDEFTESNIKKFTIGSLDLICSSVDNYENKQSNQLKQEIEKAIKKSNSLVIYDLGTYLSPDAISAELVVNVGDDEKVTLNCKVEKSEKVILAYEWYLNGDLLKSKRGSSIKINPDDQRSYQCVVKDLNSGCSGQTKEYSHSGKITNKSLRFDLPKEVSKYDEMYSEYLQFGPTLGDDYIILTSRVPGCDWIKIRVIDETTNKKVNKNTEFEYQKVIAKNEIDENRLNNAAFDENDIRSTSEKENDRFIKNYSDYLLLFLRQGDLGTKWEEGNEIPLLRIEIIFSGSEMEEDLVISKKVILHRCPLYIE
jgi:hypothetical protein